MAITEWLSSLKTKKTIFDKHKTNSIIRGETSVQIFELPSSPESYTDIIVSYSQDNFVWVQKHKADLRLDENMILFNLSETETALFDSCKKVKCQIKLVSDDILESKVLELEVIEGLDASTVLNDSLIQQVGRASVSMQTIDLKLFNKLFTGGSPLYTISCVFDSTWKNLTKIFTFRNEYGDKAEGTIDNVIDNVYNVLIPHSMLEKPGNLYLGVSGKSESGDVVRVSGLSNSAFIHSSSEGLAAKFMLYYGAFTEVPFGFMKDMFSSVAQSYENLEDGVSFTVSAGVVNEDESRTRQYIVFAVPKSIKISMFTTESSRLMIDLEEIDSKDELYSMYYVPTPVYDRDLGGTTYLLFGGEQ